MNILKILSRSLWLLLLLEFGCTQNNGHIGPVFGSWALTEITEDGVSLDLTGETVFSFQNEVVQVELIRSDFDRLTRFGNFSISGGVLSLKFMSRLTPEGEGGQYLMPEWLYFPDGEMPLRFDVLTLKGNEMKWSIDNGGKTYVYVFRKTW